MSEEPKGTGVYINIEVDNIDNYYNQLKAAGKAPSTEPRDWPWGQREFVICDPDRYKLVFYQKTALGFFLALVTAQQQPQLPLLRYGQNLAH
jgi:uncharacterized glyoxalase superfamily protein PhnB